MGRTGGRAGSAALAFLMVGIAQACINAPMDIVLLLDSSENLRSEFFAVEKQFAKDVIANIAGNDNRVGLFTFGQNAHVQFHMDKYQTASEMTSAIDYLWYSGGMGDPYNALQVALDSGFNTATGDREEVPNVLLMLTHSPVENTAALEALKDQFSVQNIDLIMVTMGTEINNAGYVSLMLYKDGVYEAADFNVLSTLPAEISSKICEGRGYFKTWTDWLPCSKSCGEGFIRRARSCVRKNDEDRICPGATVEEVGCKLTDCTEPVNGGWTFWDTWGQCDMTCGGGQQIRQRYCTAPTPANGGAQCQGSDTEARACAEWNCPDCTRSCPSGGVLSEDCSVCMCASVTIYGKIKDILNRTVINAAIYAPSNRQTPLTYTDSTGDYTLEDVCAVSETFVVEKTNYISTTALPVQVNATHWQANAEMNIAVAPFFTRHPQSKSRIVGQSVSLCCQANGTPPPTVYTWTKDGEEMGAGTTFIIDSISLEDSGDYICSAQSTAGVTLSETAIVRVKDAVDDTCDEPRQKLETLPEGCFLQGDEAKSPVIDVGTCDRSSSCVTSSLVNNASCSDWWPRHCCDASDAEIVDIICDGFSYNLKVIKSCICQECITKTVVSGTVYAKKDGVKIPMKFVTVDVDGRTAAMTNLDGFFRFEVHTDRHSVVINFIDEIFEEMVATTKTVDLTDGLVTSLDVLVPLKPEPVSFDTSKGFDLNLGDASLPSVVHMSFGPNAVTTETGEPVTGNVTANVYFMDPRNRDDIEASSREFNYETQDGSQLPLETYGFFNLQLKDGLGNPLLLNKPIDLEFDQTDVPLDEDGNPDLYLWDFDMNKGVWVMSSQLEFVSENFHGRKLLQTSTLRGQTHPNEIPLLDHEGVNVTTRKVIVGYYKNTDRPIYETREVRNTYVKRDACFVGVSVYEDMSLQSPIGAGITVTAIARSYRRNQDTMELLNYRGRVERATRSDGSVCIEIFCDSYIYLYARNRDGSLLLTPESHFVPPFYPHRNTKNFTEVEFESLNFDGIFHEGQERTGPVYYRDDVQECRGNNGRDLRFQFAPFTREPVFTPVVNPGRVNNRQSWFAFPANSPSRRVCFVKVLVRTTTLGIRLIGTSSVSASGEPYGTHEVGPIPDPGSDDRTTLGACLQYRCTGVVNDNGNYEHDVLTTVNVNIDKNIACTVRALHDDVTEIFEATNGGRGFRLRPQANINYGPVFGIYINRASEDEVEGYCRAGRDTGSGDNRIMRPSINPAVEFNCD